MKNGPHAVWFSVSIQYADGTFDLESDTFTYDDDWRLYGPFPFQLRATLAAPALCEAEPLPLRPTG